MKNNTVTIAGETFALAFTMDALDMIERAIPEFNMNSVSDHARRPGHMVDILYAMAQQGELLEGREIARDRAWFGSHIPAAPRKIAQLQVAVFNCMTEALKMEQEVEKPAVRDLVLEEIKKNEEKAASPTEPSSTMD